MKVSNIKIYLLGVLTLVLFPAFGILIHGLLEESFQSTIEIFESEYNIWFQFFIGSIVGLFFGFLAWQLVKSNFMRPVLVKYGDVVKALHLNIYTIIFLSFCAGVGEEFFFRGVVQNYLGVTISAIVFVLVHGYLNPFDKIIFVYGIVMTLFIIILGYMDVYLGLVSAMAAHMMIDVVLFYHLSKINIEEMSSTKSDAQISESNQ